MDEIKKIIDDLAIAALEANTKIASLAVISDSGDLIYLTENWDLSSYTDTILKVIRGDHTFVINNVKFSVIETSAKGIIATSDSGMGYAIYTPFLGGVLVSFAMPGADPPRILSFLKEFALRLNGKV